MLPRQQHLLTALASCVATCELYAAHLLTSTELPRQIRSLQLCRDCADLGRLTAAFVARNAEHAPYLLRECAELCRTCADECAQFAGLACRECTEACRRAEDACRTAYV